MNLLTEIDELEYFLKSTIKFDTNRQYTTLMNKLKKKDMTELMTQMTFYAFNASKSNNMIMAQPITQPIADDRCNDLQKQIIDKDKHLEMITKDKDKQIKHLMKQNKELEKAPKDRDKQIKQFMKQNKELSKAPPKRYDDLKEQLDESNKFREKDRKRAENLSSVLQEKEQEITNLKDDVEYLKDHIENLKKQLTDAREYKVKKKEMKAQADRFNPFVIADSAADKSIFSDLLDSYPDSDED